MSFLAQHLFYIKYCINNSFHMLTAGQSSISLREERKLREKYSVVSPPQTRDREIGRNIQSAQQQLNKQRRIWTAELWTKTMHFTHKDFLKERERGRGSRKGQRETHKRKEQKKERPKDIRGKPRYFDIFKINWICKF